MINRNDPIYKPLMRSRLKICFLIIVAVFCAEMLVLTLFKMSNPDALKAFQIFMMFMPAMYVPMFVMMTRPPAPAVRQYFDEHGKLPPGQSPAIIDFLIAAAILAAIVSGYVFIKMPFARDHYRNTLHHSSESH